MGHDCSRAIRHCALGVAATAFVAAWAQPARASDAPPSATTPAASSPPRPLPDYGGRPDAEPPGDGAGVWVARVFLAPLYLISEFVLRRPLGAATVAAERADLPNKFYDFFAFGPDHKSAYSPWDSSSSASCRASAPSLFGTIFS